MHDFGEPLSLLDILTAFDSQVANSERQTLASLDRSQNQSSHAKGMSNLLRGWWKLGHMRLG